jgi:hypothetical protein
MEFSGLRESVHPYQGFRIYWIFRIKGIRPSKNQSIRPNPYFIEKINPIFLVTLFLVSLKQLK